MGHDPIAFLLQFKMATLIGGDSKPCITFIYETHMLDDRYAGRLTGPSVTRYEIAAFANSTASTATPQSGRRED
jgi:hypothetical protein